MSNWKTVRLGDVCVLNYGKSLVATNRKAGAIPVYSSAGITGWHNEPLINGEGIIIGRKGTVGSVYHSITPFCCIDTAYYVLPNENYDFKFLHYRLKSLGLEKLNEDSAVPGLNRETAYSQEFPLPPIEEQRRIAGILGVLDDKIECNNRINRNLEQQAAALFRRWFVDFEFPDSDPTSPTYGKPYRSAGGKMQDSTLGPIPQGWQVGTLTSIANYLNGLAMQKFRPLNNEKGIPVLKIKELGQKKCDSSSDLCSEYIKPEYIVNDGDIIFSWSGTLMIDIWCGGKCGLNQHLFKVTSEKYPKWFYYFWTDYHLHKFIKIAKDKAVTMGHIKREDLNNSAVIIPDDFTLEINNDIIAPLLDKIISNNLESRNLATLRDTLLPKLMNNQIKV